MITYSHTTNHSFKPKREFWRAFENLFRYFPFLDKQEANDRFDWDSYNKLTKFYEMHTLDAFEVRSKMDIYGSNLKQVLSFNYLGKLIKFLAENISNPDTVHKFQNFFESMYYYLLKFHSVISLYGAIKPSEYVNYFNSNCRKHGVPFVMFTQNNECYVVHITDIFVEKAILDIPVFLKNNNLKQANSYFIKAITWRDKGNYPECLNNTRSGMEEIRDFIFTRYELPKKSNNLYNDFRMIFEKYSNVVFDYSKIPETDTNNLEKIIAKLKESALLTVKITNIGSHQSSALNLIEENTSLFALGLVASIFPYLFYLLKEV